MSEYKKALKRFREVERLINPASESKKKQPADFEASEIGELVAAGIKFSRENPGTRVTISLEGETESGVDFRGN